MKSVIIDPSLLRKMVVSNVETGIIFWAKRERSNFHSDKDWKTWNTRFAGKQAFNTASMGYRIGHFQGRMIQAHKVIWALANGVWPVYPEQIDHINGDRSDNRLANLRLVSPSANRRNMRRPAHNTSGHVGVYWNRQRSAWQAQASDGKKTVCLGRFTTVEEAVAARLSYNETNGFHVNHGRSK